MDKPFDPNVPDCSNGDFFCKLCLASMNSDQMWSSHIVGKRHIKNVAAYPNGLPRPNFDDENSYDRPPKMGRYDDMDDYPPPPDYPENYPDYPVYPDYYEEDYYDRRPTAYVPPVRAVVVHDYGHKKVDEPNLKIEPKKSEGYSDGGKRNDKIDIDSIIDEVKKSVSKENGGQAVEEPKKDDFFEKLNEKFLAEDLAEEIVKKRLQEQKKKVESRHKPTESSKEQKNDARHSKERKNREISPDVLDNIYKYSDHKHSKNSDSDKKLSSSSKSSSSKSSTSKSSSSKSSSSKSSSSKSSSSKSSSSPQSKKLPVRLDKIDPDDLTPDMLDDLLSSYLKPKIDSMVKETVTTFDKEPKKKEENLDDMYVLAKKISDLPTKTFLQLALEKMRHINLKDSEELQMVFQVICQAQNIICTKLPPRLQAVVTEKMSRNCSKTTESEVQSTSVSQQPTVAPVPSQILTTTFPPGSIAASYSSLIQNAAAALNTTAVSSAAQMQQSIMAQTGPITSISMPTQSSPVLQSGMNQSLPQLPAPSLPVYPPPVYPTSLSMGAIPPNFYPYMYGAQVANGSFPSATGVQLNFPGYLPSTTVSQSQPTHSTSLHQKRTKTKVTLLATPPPPPSLLPTPTASSLLPTPTTSPSNPLYQRFVSSTSLPTGIANPNFNLTQMLNQAQAAAGGFSTATGVQSGSVNYSTAGQNKIGTNCYQTINSTVGNTLPGVSSSTTSVASSPASKNTEATLASLKSLAEEYASKNKNSSVESGKKTIPVVIKRSRWC